MTVPPPPDLVQKARELAEHPQPSGYWQVADVQFIADAKWLLPKLADESEVLAGQIRRAYSEGVAVARKLQGRLDRIAQAHSKQVDEHGGTTGDCNECGWLWPCPTYAWATSDRDPVVATWDPSDDEAPTDV